MTQNPTTQALLEAALPHVAFDGWSPATFKAAVQDSGLDETIAQAACPNGALDLAIAYHKLGDDLMRAGLAEMDLTAYRFRDRVAEAVRLRLRVIDDKEAVRRGTTLFALPHMAAEGARLVWGTSDAIWTALGDTSEDGNWYTKRLTLSGVYSSAVLFWLGDDSLGMQATDAFIDRRIDNVMQIERWKAQARQNPVSKPFAQTIDRVMAGIRPPCRPVDDNLPGIWRD